MPDDEKNDGGGFDPFEFSYSSPVAAPTPKFWQDLAGVVGKNKMGSIVFQEEILTKGQLKDPGSNNKGVLYVGAIKNRENNGYVLTRSVTHFAGAEKVYWLPWRSGHNVYAERAWFEKSNCNFFMTSAFTGCRFVLTDKYVMHIAANTDRNALQNSLTAGGRARTLSLGDIRDKGTGRVGTPGNTPADHLYGYDDGGGAAMVFGIKTDNGWIYVTLKYRVNATQDGTWSRLVVP